MKNFGIIIEARLASTRLPNKVIKKIKGFTLIEFLILRLKSLHNVKIILATSNKKENTKLCNIAIKNNISFFRGSEENVLIRVLNAAKKNNIENIISITGDCPIVCPDLVFRLIEFYKKNYNKVDYVSIRNFVGGMDTQIYKTKALEKSYKLCKSRLNKEHVTLFIRKSNKFKKKFLFPRKNELLSEHWSLVVDQKEDLTLMKKIITFFVIKNDYLFNYSDLILFLKKNPKLRLLNSMVNRKGDK